jgi:hypothetical protein
LDFVANVTNVDIDGMEPKRTAAADDVQALL